MIAEHEYIARRRVGSYGVGDLSDARIDSFESGKSPLVIRKGQSLPSGAGESDYAGVPEFPGLFFYVGKLPTPAAGGALVPPHLTAEMANKLEAIPAKSLSGLSSRMLGYYRGYRRTGGVTYAGGLAERDPTRVSKRGEGPLGKLTSAGEGVLSLFGLGGKKQPVAGEAPAPVEEERRRDEGGGFFAWLLSPVGVVVTTGVVVGGVVVARRMRRGRR